MRNGGILSTAQLQFRTVHVMSNVNVVACATVFHFNNMPNFYFHFYSQQARRRKEVQKHLHQLHPQPRRKTSHLQQPPQRKVLQKLRHLHLQRLRRRTSLQQLLRHLHQPRLNQRRKLLRRSPLQILSQPPLQKLRRQRPTLQPRLPLSPRSQHLRRLQLPQKRQQPL